MGRRTQIRFVKNPPNNFYFNAQIDDSAVLTLTLAEFEAMRLKHFINLSQEKAANTMGVSQPTFSRILENAHKKVTEALIRGRELRVSGGNINYKKAFEGYGCLKCNNEWEDESASRTRSVSCPNCKSNMTYYLIREPL